MQKDTPIKLNWRAYFQEFDQAHGGDPVVYGGRLLYPDGWRYALKDYAGPEWPPPEDEEELARLQYAYWGLHKQRLQQYLASRTRLVEGLRRLQVNKDQPLQHIASYLGEDGRMQNRIQALDLDDLETELAWGQQVLNDCETELQKLREKL